VHFATLDAMEEGLTRRRAVPETSDELWRCIWRYKKIVAGKKNMATQKLIEQRYST